MNDPPAFITTIESSAVGEWLPPMAGDAVRERHAVLCVTLVFGSISSSTCGLLGLFDRARGVTAITREMLRIKWVAFAGAVLTGALFLARECHDLLVKWPSG